MAEKDDDLKYHGTPNPEEIKLGRDLLKARLVRLSKLLSLYDKGGYVPGPVLAMGVVLVLRAAIKIEPEWMGKELMGFLFDGERALSERCLYCGDSSPTGMCAVCLFKAEAYNKEIDDVIAKDPQMFEETGLTCGDEDDEL